MECFKELSTFPPEDLLPTFSENIDLVLGKQICCHLGLITDLSATFSGGGLPSGCVTEIVGESGTGKTQLCLQLCANVQLPKAIGGLEGRCIYLDCNGGFDVRRLAQICKPTEELAQKIILQQKLGRVLCNQRSLTDGVLYRRVDSVHDLLSCLDDLVTEVMPNFPDVRLLIVDRSASSLLLLHHHNFDVIFLVAALLSISATQYLRAFPIPFPLCIR